MLFCVSKKKIIQFNWHYKLPHFPFKEEIPILQLNKI